MSKEKQIEEMDLINKYILDATCGSRTIWFQKNHPHTVYMDCREEHDTAIWKSSKNDSVRTLDVIPDVVADFTKMPFPDNTFNLVVFDPPHLIKVGDNAWLKKKYGKLPEEWPQLIHDGFSECMRVLKPCGTLIFKWSEVDIPTRKIIDAIGTEPLFGHRSGKAMRTHWMCFLKEADNAGYRKQSEWISVEERLPEDKQICLVYGTAYYVPEETGSEEIFTTAFYKEFGFVDQIHAHITHWMPLPEPPKMKGGGE